MLSGTADLGVVVHILVYKAVVQPSKLEVCQHSLIRLHLAGP